MKNGYTLAGWLFTAFVMAGPGSAQQGATLEPYSSPQLTAKDYDQARHLLDAAERPIVKNIAVVPNWTGDGDRFWYRKDGEDGTIFQLVDARTGKRSTAFDHANVADGLARASGKKVSPANLPFTSFRYGSDGKTIEFSVFNSIWRCSRTEADCAASPPAFPDNHAVAPDGRKSVFRRDRNLWMKTDGGAERPLTRDGIQFNEYGYVWGDSQVYASFESMAGAVPPFLAWSPDSSKFLTHRIDESRVGDITLWQGAPPDGARRPKVTTIKQSQIGDAEREITTYMIFDVARGTRIDVTNIPSGMELDPLGGMRASMAEWTPDSKFVYVMARDRHHRRISVFRVDAASGEAQPVLEETSPTFISLNGGYGGGLAVTHKVIDQGRQILWFSERDGWGHLYRYDLASGELLNPVTSGPWVVTNIVDVDEKEGIVYFLGAGREKGRNPYQNILYRVKLDGSDLRLLTPENADHEVFAAAVPARPGVPARAALSPSKSFFVDRYSRVDTTPVSVLRSTESGEVLMTIEEADHSALAGGKWTRPVPFVVKARDGKTDIFGTMYLPSDFDKTKKYPVIDNVYPGAHFIVPDVRAFSPRYYYRQALANLGFIVVNMDGLGTTGRGKAFHDLSYGNLQDGPGLPDHIAGMKELARSHPQMDLDRVGVFGHSSGGYGAALAMLKFPEFYKVGVASAAAVDMCGAIPLMLDKWQGPPQSGVPYCDQVVLAKMAPNLRGKLLIAYGDIDEHVPPGSAIQLIDALTRANRDYDLIVMPNRTHGFSQDRYFLRRMFDYFVRNLLGSEPPANASLADPEQ
ncbi:S9 family peptidase [Sphingosinicella rhizophila]|uniref:DPP IV N-terminal domain-containing protein n=1 Tax=Sphingosinicella rhizophila TaxID=3050082 RepID=A0ABU3Q6Z3_9SPHN|nr:DPP IV N-terminal domain-containing protein [Sphingosinicella sp. GR2756]MDT9598753.1 DPP IV N-terminal domain-containing protein [Sphingosinicella sp. GR2756]